MQRLDGSWSRIDDEGREHTVAFGPWEDSTWLRELDSETPAALAGRHALGAGNE
ncbi:MULTISPECIES: hypothetical protein [unclassified Nocardia]|uniref:hypothetical protein n=1 Tax=unclassified Nocardia TaxID=2637762 RepID=UPI0033AD2723